MPVRRRCLRAGRHRGLRQARRAPRAIRAGACIGALCGAEYPATKQWTGPACRCGEVCKAQIETGGVDMRQCKSKRSKLDEIHRNAYEIRTKFVRISCEFHISRKFTQIYSREICTKFVRNSYEFCTNFVRISREFCPICQYTKQTHKQAHLALAWASDAPCPGPRALGRPPRWDRVHQVP